MVDHALDFVMSKIDRWIGTRSESAQAPTIYEIPREVVGEAIVNAVAHLGTGTGDMITRCRQVGLREPEFREDGGCFVLTVRRKTAQVTPEVTPEDTPEVGTKSGPSCGAL